MNQNSSENLIKPGQGSYKIREFEWFEVETKIRLFVQRLLEPTLKQIHEDRVVVDQISQQIKHNNKEVLMLRDIVLDQGAGIPIFQEFRQKFMELDLKLDKQRREQMEDVNAQNKQVDKLENEISKIRLIAQNIENAKIKLEQEQQDQKVRNEDFRTGIEQLIRNLSNEITSNFTDSKHQLNRLDNSIKTCEVSLTDTQNKQKIEELRINQLQSSYIELQKVLNCYTGTFEQIEQKFLKFDMLHGTIKKAMHAIDELTLQTKSIEQFLILYSPLYIQGQISETLYNCLSVSQINKMCGFEKIKLESLDRKILDFKDGNQGIQKLIDSAALVIEEITKRNVKIVQTMRVKELESSKSNLASVRGSDSDEDEQQSEKTSKAKNSSPSVRRKNQNILDLGVNEQEIQLLKEDFDSRLKSLENKLHQKQRDFDVSLRDIDQQYNLISAQLQGQLQNMVQKQEIFVKKVEDKMITFQQKDTHHSLDNSNGFSSQKKVTQTILHHLVLVTHLLIQDEIDRQGIQLLGTKEVGIDDGLVTGATKKQGPIQLQSDCLSCSGQPIQLLQQFKLACLAYHPSDIVVDGRVYKRDRLLEMCTQLLRQAKDDYQDSNQIAQLLQQKQQFQLSNPPLTVRQNRSTSVASPMESQNHRKKIRKLAPMTNLHEL